ITSRRAGTLTDSHRLLALWAAACAEAQAQQLAGDESRTREGRKLERKAHIASGSLTRLSADGQRTLDGPSANVTYKCAKRWILGIVFYPDSKSQLRAGQTPIGPATQVLRYGM